MRQRWSRVVFVLSLLLISGYAFAQNDSCLTEINGALKGGPGNVQDHMFHSLTIDPKNENIVYAGTETNGMFKTTDAGRTWMRLRQGLKCTANQTGYSQILDIAIDPNNSNILYASTVNGPGPAGNPLSPSSSGGVYKSTDGGLTWHQKVSGLSNTYAQYVLIDPVNPNRLLVGIGGLKSTFSQTLNTFFEGGIYFSTSAGDTWTPLSLPAGMSTNVFVDMVIRGSTPQIMYASAQVHGSDAPTDLGLAKSSDGGMTWSNVNPPGEKIFGFDVFKNDPSLIYGHDNSPGRRVHKSTDAGMTWSVVPNASFFGTIRVHPTNNQVIFYTGFHSILRTTDGFATRPVVVYEDSAQSSSRQMTDIEISQSNPNVVWASAKGYVLYKSTDGGATFVRITSIRDIVYGSPTTIGDEGIMQPALTFSLQQNYPNPFNPETTIDFQLSRSEFVVLKVFNILGSEVATLVRAELPGGSHAVSFNASLLPSGVYFYRLQTANLTATRSMIILK